MRVNFLKSLHMHTESSLKRFDIAQRKGPLQQKDPLTPTLSPRKGRFSRLQMSFAKVSKEKGILKPIGQSHAKDSLKA